MMAFWYLVLAVCLAVMLNAGNRYWRALGTTVAALSLVMMVSSIILADFDGTFAAVWGRAGLAGEGKILILNLQAVVGTVGILFLLWAAWRQVLRRGVLPLAMLNSADGFGRVSRYAHWVVAVLMLALIPMGMFMSVLPANAPDRASFLAAHQSMGLLVLVFAVARITWLLRSPPAAFPGELRLWERRLAHGVHLTLYGLILAFPVSGVFETMCRGQAVRFFGQTIPAFPEPSPAWSSGWAMLHDRVLPLVFFGVIFAHLGAVLKHHFVDRRVSDVRRMLR